MTSNPLKNTRPLSLRIPEPRFRPGEHPDFSRLNIPEAGETPRPEVDAHPQDMRELAYGMVRVLTKDGAAVGPWDPKIGVEVMKRGLRTMMLTRVYDDRMYRAQRQGKTSFYMKSTGEEAVSVDFI
jgi:2-oxoisovalerate dehydrogenase E1 component alpha subunit